MKRHGLLISFEGVDGSGKSTQAKLLYEYLQKEHFRVRFIREPGGTQISERIRKILLDPEIRDMGLRTELLLFLASRAELVEKVIAPAISKGEIVIADRFADSTFAYQVFGRRLPNREVRLINNFAVSKIKPDLTFLVDMPPEAAHKRLNKTKDRMESENMQFHRRVRNGFLKLARSESQRIRLLDGRLSPDEIWKEVRSTAMTLVLRRGIATRAQSSN